MNFYNRFVGDFQRDTGHLSCAEMGVYDRLLDHYYATEIPLPASLESCCRIARAMSKDERKAVDAVLAQFFVSTEKGYTQKRAAEEIEKAKPKIAAAKTNGAKGGRPPKNPKQTQAKPNGFPLANPDVTQVETSPEPDPYKPSEQRESRETGESIGTGTAVPLTLVGEICTGLKAMGMGMMNQSNPDFVMLLEAGADADEFLNTAAEIKAKSPDKFFFNYLVSTVKHRRIDAKNNSSRIFRGPLQTQQAQQPKTASERRRQTAVAMFPSYHNQDRQHANIIDITPANSDRALVSQDG